MEIGPLKGEQFTAAAPCRRRQDDEGIKPRIARLLEQGPKRPLIEDWWSPLRQLWKEDASESTMYRRVPMCRDRLWRERPPIQFRLGASAAVILQAVNGLLDLSRRQHIQGRLTKLADHIRSPTHRTVPLFSGRSAAGVLLEPVVRVTSFEIACQSVALGRASRANKIYRRSGFQAFVTLSREWFGRDALTALHAWRFYTVNFQYPGGRPGDRLG